MDNPYQDSDNQSPGQSPQSENNFLVLQPLTIEYLREIAKWARLLGILGLVCIGLGLIFLVLAGISMGSLSDAKYGKGMPQFTAIFMTIPSFLITLIYIYPIWCLYKFGKNLKVAIDIKDSLYLENAFNYLKKHYRFIGILIFVLIGIYVLMVVGFLIAFFSGTMANL